jgi:hypothetical protein
MNARAGATDRRGHDVSVPGRTGQPGSAAGARVRGGEREGRSDLDRRAGIRSVQLRFKSPDLGRTPEI